MLLLREQHLQPWASRAYFCFLFCFPFPEAPVAAGAAAAAGAGSSSSSGAGTVNAAAALGKVCSVYSKRSHSIFNSNKQYLV